VQRDYELGRRSFTSRFFFWIDLTEKPKERGFEWGEENDLSLNLNIKLHGENHPGVTVSNCRLVYRGNIGEMQIIFVLLGLVDGFAYVILAQEIDSAGGVAQQRSSNYQVPSVHNRHTHSNQHTIILKNHPNYKQNSKFRVEVSVWDNFAGLSLEEGIVARKEIWLPLEYDYTYFNRRVDAIRSRHHTRSSSSRNSTVGKVHTCSEDVLFRSEQDADSKNDNVTLATVASFDRCLTSLYLAAHWDGPLSIVYLAANWREHAALEAFVSQTLVPFCHARSQPLTVTLLSECKTVKTTRKGFEGRGMGGEEENDGEGGGGDGGGGEAEEDQRDFPINRMRSLITDICGCIGLLYEYIGLVCRYVGLLGGYMGLPCEYIGLFLEFAD